MILAGQNRRNSKDKNCATANPLITNPTVTNLGTKPGVGCERPTTNHLIHGTINAIILPLAVPTWLPHWDWWMEETGIKSPG
jgi:hypothetical protein